MSSDERNSGADDECQSSDEESECDTDEVQSTMNLNSNSDFFKA